MLPVGSQAPHRAEHEEIVDWLLRPDNNRNWGVGLCFLNLRIKPRKPLAREKLQPLSVPEAINQVGRWTSCTTNSMTGEASGCST